MKAVVVVAVMASLFMMNAQVMARPLAIEKLEKRDKNDTTKSFESNPFKPPETGWLDLLSSILRPARSESAVHELHSYNSTTVKVPEQEEMGNSNTTIVKEPEQEVEVNLRNCTVPGREYLMARYHKNILWTDYAKFKLGTGSWVATYWGGASDDSWKDEPMQAEQANEWYKNNGEGKFFVLRSVQSGGQGWLRTAQYGGKCAGFSQDGKFLTMWRCNRDGKYASFFISATTIPSPDGMLMFQSNLYLRNPDNESEIYRPYVHAETVDGKTSARIFLDKCAPGYAPEETLPAYSNGQTYTPDENLGLVDTDGSKTKRRERDRDFTVAQTLPFQSGERLTPEQNVRINAEIDASLATLS